MSVNRGYFLVYTKEDEKEIYISPNPDCKDESPPENQKLLIEEIQKTLTGIQVIFRNDDARFKHYFLILVSLAQVGLVGLTAQPDIAFRSLTGIKNEIILKEGQRIKNAYMILLGLKATVLAIPVLIIAILLLSFFPQLNVLSRFLLLWVGCMAGVWLSFGARKVILSFEDLQEIEKDKLEPTIRLIFAGMLSVFIGLLFSTRAVSVIIGNISTDLFTDDSQIAILIGCICGFSELSLASRITKKAVSIMRGI